MKISTVKLVKKIRIQADIPARGPAEVCFVGRSNVGKSSAMNTLVGRHVLSPVSKNPGRTRQLLYYLINEKFYFVDLPGYGFARRNQADRDRWHALLDAYLARDTNPKGIIHILDIRHDPSELDMEMISWLAESGKPTLILLTKADKLSKGKIKTRVLQIAHDIPGIDPGSLISFSAKTGDGKKDVWGAISSLLRI